MFPVCESNGNLYFVDSNLHRDRGYLIASTPQVERHLQIGLIK